MIEDLGNKGLRYQDLVAYGDIVLRNSAKQTALLQSTEIGLKFIPGGV